VPDKPMSKKVWRKPEVRRMRAGAAEFNNGQRDDGDNGSALNNS
jgi:hypothetical protein